MPGSGKRGVMSYTATESCPECGSYEIEVIDHIWNPEEQQNEQRCICWTCQHDWHELEENQ